MGRAFARAAGQAVRSIALAGAVAALATALTGCGVEEALVLPEDGALFVLEVSGEEFHAVVTDLEAVRALLDRRDADVEGVVSGRLVRGDGGFNQPWGWHWEPESVHVPDQSMELCDGRPSMVDEDLDYWVDTVAYFCPWGATVVRRER